MCISGSVYVGVSHTHTFTHDSGMIIDEKKAIKGGLWFKKNYESSACHDLKTKLITCRRKHTKNNLKTT